MRSTSRSEGSNLPAPTACPGQEDLDARLAAGVAWTAGSRWALQIVTWASTLLLARLLSPGDFGLVGMAGVYTGFALIVSEFGLGTAIVVTRGLSRIQLRQLNFIAAALGFSMFGLSAAAAPAVAWYFHSDRLTGVLVAMSFLFVAAGFRTVPAALVQKDMAFRTASTIEVVQGLLQSLTTVALAWTGFGVWALVAGNLAGSIASSAMSSVARPVGFSWPCANGISLPVRRGFHLLLSRVCWYAYSNADFFVASKVLGAPAVGAYTFAWTIAGAPVEKITLTVTRVTTPVFAKVQQDKAALRRYLVVLTEVLAFVTFPAAAGLAVTAPLLVPTLLGEKWVPAILPLRILAVYGSLRSICTLLPQVLTALGSTRFGMLHSLWSLAVLAPAFWYGSRWGLEGIATGWVLGYPVAVLPLYWRVFRAIDMPVATYALAILPAGICSLIMAGSVLYMNRILSGDVSGIVRLATLCAAGICVYLLAFRMLFANQLELYWKRRRTLLNRSTPPAHTGSAQAHGSQR